MLTIQAAEDVGFQRPLDVVADEEVEEAVAVVVEPNGRRAEALTLAETRGIGDIDERPFAGVAEESVLADSGDENVGKAVVVVVANGNSHAVEFDIEAGARGYISECAVAVVVVKTERGAGFLVTGPVRTVDQEDVLPAVTIVVEKGASRAESFRQELATESAAIVLKMDTGLAGDVGEAKPECIAVRRLCREGLQPQKLRPRCESRHALQEMPAIHGTFTSPARMA